MSRTGISVNVTEAGNGISVILAATKAETPEMFKNPSHSWAKHPKMGLGRSPELSKKKFYVVSHAEFSRGNERARNGLIVASIAHQGCKDFM